MPSRAFLAPLLVGSAAALGLLLAGAASALPGPRGGSAAPGKETFGWIERVTVSSEGLNLKAKLDTGAQTSSLHASNISEFRRDGKRYVRFEVGDPELEGKVILERRLSRRVRIREHDGSYQRRPVVLMWICIGRHKKRIEVNLVDRSEFNYPFLLGRSAMEGHILVDPGESFTRQPTCDLEGMDQ